MAWKFDEHKARRAVEFFGLLRHVEGEWSGKPFLLAPWQADDLIRPLFGTVDASTGLRRFTEFYCQLGKGSGKSVLAAGISLYMLLADGEERALVVNCAADRSQAGTVFNFAKDMLLASPTLRAAVDDGRIIIGKDVIRYPRNNGTYRVTSRESGAQDGKSAHCVIVDEYHTHRDGSQYSIWRKNIRSRREPVVGVITTAGYDLNHPCYQLYLFAKKVAQARTDGEEIAANFLPVIYESNADDPWDDEETWKKALPNYPTSPKRERVRELVDKARQMPAELREFRTKYCNMWISDQLDTLLSAETWSKADANVLSIAELETRYRGCIAYAGLDMSLCNDLSALTIIIPQPDDELIIVPYVWLPSDGLKDREPAGKFELWRDMGLLETHAGNAIDDIAVANRVLQICKIFDIKKLAYDRAYASTIVMHLQRNGMAEKLVDFPQYPRFYTDPIGEMVKLYLAGKLKHSGNELLAWQAGNLRVKTLDDGKMLPNKEDRAKKIDSMSALLMALGARLDVAKADAVLNDIDWAASISIIKPN